MCVNCIIGPTEWHFTQGIFYDDFDNLFQALQASECEGFIAQPLQGDIEQVICLKKKTI